MRYEYVNCKGERRTVERSMQTPPAEFLFYPNGLENWEPAAAESFDTDPRIFRRDYSNAATASIVVKDHAVKYKIPASRSLPRRKGGKLDKLHGHDVKRHADGGYTTMDGRPIVQNRTDSEREQRRTGLDREW